MTSISTLGLTYQLTSGLDSQKSVLATLGEEVASGVQHDNLTDYDPTDAHNILDFQNAVTQRQSYIASMQNVQTRLTVYDSTLTDIETMATQAGSLATQNQSYNATTAPNIGGQVTSYLKELTDDLNQQIGGRYIYAGSRYSTAPVTDLSALTGTPTTTTTTSPALPSYDTDYSNATSFSVNATPPTGSFTVGNVSIPWSSLSSGTVSTVKVNGVSTAVTVSGLSSGGTKADLAANLAATINQINTQVPGASGIGSLTATSSSNGVTLNFGGTTPLSVTPDANGSAGETTWVGGSTPDGTVAQTPNSSAPAYALDSAQLDSNYSVSYGLSSNDPNFQKLVNGLRFMASAVTAGQSGDTATYQSDMQKASSLLSTALAGIQGLHAGVANNQSTLTNEIATQNTDITTLQNQLTSIQQVDLTQVGTEITALQTQLQASYSSTASLQQLSLLKYL